MDKQISFAEKIRTIRKARNLTMEAFGEIVGVSKGTVSLWESGKNIPPKTTISLIDKLFGEGTVEYEKYKVEEKPLTVEEKPATYNASDIELSEIIRLLKEHPQDKKLVLKLLKGKKDIKEALEGFGVKKLIEET